MDLDNIDMQHYEPAMGPYGVSKLANIMFTRELSKRLEGSGLPLFYSLFKEVLC
jgi:NAD(P)-dependent dehydrogenase (short-subunit alcohol dehydrogenase family)